MIVASSPDPTRKKCMCFSVCGCLIGEEQAYREGTEAFLVGYELNVTQTPPNVVKALIMTCVFK